jgi:hypothetical protein
MAEWRERWARPETQDELHGMMQSSGFSKDRAAAALKVIEHNTATLDEALEQDLNYVQKFNVSDPEPANFTAAQQAVLDAINGGAPTDPAAAPAKNLVMHWLGAHGSAKRLNLLASHHGYVRPDYFSSYLKLRPHGPSAEDLAAARRLAKPEEAAELEKAIVKFRGLGLKP